MNKYRLAFFFLAVTNLRAARLEVFAVRTGADFSIHRLSGEPDFQIVGLRCGKSHVSGAKLHYSIWQVQTAQNLFSIPQQYLIAKRRLREAPVTAGGARVVTPVKT